MSKIQDNRIYLRANGEQKRRLNLAAEQLEVPVSIILRDAIEEKLAKLAKRIPALRTVEQPTEIRA